MSLTLHFHPLASFCWKALIALYENDTPFTPNSVDLGNPAERAALLKLWPIGKFPVLRDEARNQRDRKSTRLNSSHGYISYAVFCLKKKNDNGGVNTMRKWIITRFMHG